MDTTNELENQKELIVTAVEQIYKQEKQQFEQTTYEREEKRRWAIEQAISMGGPAMQVNTTVINNARIIVEFVEE